MQSFIVLERLLAQVPGPLVTRLSRIDSGRGREGLYRAQLPALLTDLAARARVQSVTASSALEGVTVADPARAARIIAGRAALRTRSEQELAGYRRALDYLFTQDWRPLNIGLLLHLHRELFAETSSPGGQFKTEDNLVVDRDTQGSVAVRFRPVPAARTEFAVGELIAYYGSATASGRHHPVLLVGLFVLDLLTIHPFTDGNGRVARLLTNALLADLGYGVGRYVSIEQLVAEEADRYYETLLASTHEWHEAEHDPWPWLDFVTVLLDRAYDRLERGVASTRSAGTKQDRVAEWVRHHAGPTFRIADVRAALPGISDPTIRLALDALRTGGVVAVDGAGRSATWRRLPTAGPADPPARPSLVPHDRRPAPPNPS
jgi:Fic family protein